MSRIRTSGTPWSPSLKPLDGKAKPLRTDDTDPTEIDGRSLITELLQEAAKLLRGGIAFDFKFGEGDFVLFPPGLERGHDLAPMLADVIVCLVQDVTSEGIEH